MVCRFFAEFLPWLGIVYRQWRFTAVLGWVAAGAWWFAEIHGYLGVSPTITAALFTLAKWTAAAIPPAFGIEHFVHSLMIGRAKPMWVAEAPRPERRG